MLLNLFFLLSSLRGPAQPPSVFLPASSACKEGQETQRGQAASYAWMTSNVNRVLRGEHLIGEIKCFLCWFYCKGHNGKLVSVACKKKFLKKDGRDHKKSTFWWVMLVQMLVSAAVLCRVHLICICRVLKYMIQVIFCLFFFFSRSIIFSGSTYWNLKIVLEIKSN